MVVFIMNCVECGTAFVEIVFQYKYIESCDNSCHILMYLIELQNCNSVSFYSKYSFVYACAAVLLL